MSGTIHQEARVEPPQSSATGAAGKRMRILEIETFGRGGLIHYTYNLSCALAERGHDVTLVTTAAYELDARSLPSNLQVVKSIARFTSRPHKWLTAGSLDRARRLEAVFDAFQTGALARRLRPDIIHFHSTNSSAWLYLRALRRLQNPVVTTAHVVTPHEPIPLQRALYGRIHRSSRLVVAHSEYDRRRLLEEFAIDPDRVVVIPHGEYGFFDSDRQAEDREAARSNFGFGPRDEVALFFGYIREYKGLDLLFEAWPEVVDSRPRARLLVAGDPSRIGSSRASELEAWATSLGAVHRFEYIPFSEVAHYFAAADVLVMPYRHISQSGVLYLALSLGVPVVATRVGGLSEVLREGQSALLIPPESRDSLAEALIRLLGDADLRGRLANAGRRLAAEHSWPAIAEKTERAFSRISGG